MKNKIFGFVAIALSLLVLANIAIAHGGRSNRFSTGLNMHSYMEEIIEQGEYSNLEVLREKLGFNIMPMIGNEQDFREMQEMHESMEELHEKYGYGMMGYGMTGNFGNRMMNMELERGCH